MTASPDYQHLIVDRRGPVIAVTLNRPDVHNAFNPPLIAELTYCFGTLGADARVRAIVLTGAGASFSAGADLRAMRQSLALTPAENLADAERLAELFETIDRCPWPVVARVNGAAFGGGVGLVAVCDLAVAVEGARFAFSEVKLGIAPAVISPFVVRRIGLAQARALFLTGARFDAPRAQAIGLIHEVVPADQLDIAVDAHLTQFLSSGPEAVAAVKRLLADVPALDAAATRRATTELIARLRTSPEGQEGIRAFLEKRQAHWVAAWPNADD